MRRTLDAGITSVRDAGRADVGMKQAVETGVVVGPRMQISTAVLTITGGHADGWMRSGNAFQLFPAYPGFPMAAAMVWMESSRRYMKCCERGPTWLRFAPQAAS